MGKNINTDDLSSYMKIYLDVSRASMETSTVKTAVFFSKNTFFEHYKKISNTGPFPKIDLY